MRVVRALLAPLLLAALTALAAPAGAQAQSAARIASALEREPVYVSPRARPGLSDAARGRLQLRILDKQIGRIKIAVVPRRSASGAAALGNAVDRRLRSRGALLIVAGGAYHVITSYRDPDRAAAAVRRAVNATAGDPLARTLASAIDRLARVDPGPSADLAAAPDGGGASGLPSDGALPDFGGVADSVEDTVRIVGWSVAIAIALPFLFVALVLVRRSWRRRADLRAHLAEQFEDAELELHALGDDIRALDVDVSLPGADPAGVASYERALSYYERAGAALPKANTPRRLKRAQALLAQGTVAMAQAKHRLGRAVPSS